MNKIYRLIWSNTLNCLIVIAEAGRRGKAGRLAATLVSSAALAAPALAQSVLPDGGRVVSGQGEISISGNAMTVRQSTGKLIANWQSFSIGKGAAVTFVQPNATSVALNRVVGQSPSQILGTLNANGRVFLLNPNGVLIGSGGSVQTGAFVASTLGLADDDFLAGKYRFSGLGGAIANQGSIKGGVVALIAPSVTNEGAIQGSAALAAGTDALLDFDGDGLLSVQVKASTLATLVQNKGIIQADGGTVILTAKGASDALKGVVNNTGTVQARTMVNQQGRILLLGDMQHGETDVGGTLDASAPQDGDGGFIETSAAAVKMAPDARVTTRAASGKTGNWLIDPNDFTIAASGGNLTGSALSSQLAGSNITISTATQGTAGGNGDIFVNDTVNWSTNTLTLHAERNITVNSAMTASATGGLALEYGQGAVAAGNTATYAVNAPINLASTGSFSTKLGSDGTAVNYTIVTSLGSAGSSNDGTLQGSGGNLFVNYVLGADVDASATSSWNSGAGFAPIGDNSTGDWHSQFGATFDGLGHTITGLAINRPATNSVGLFGYIGGSGVVRNVGLGGGSVTGNNYVGQLAGQNAGSISSSHASGTVGGQSSIGGLAGVNNGGTLSGTYATGNVTASASSSDAGGLVGYQTSATITNSHATGQVSGVDNAGGLVGFQNSGSISQSYATGSVTASASSSNAGGLVGYLNGGTVGNVYATGTVSGNDSVGGLVGFLNNGSTPSPSVSNAYATGSVTSASIGFVGGLIGFATSGTTVSNSYWDTSTTGRNLGCGAYSASTCAIGLTTTQAQSPFTFIDGGWNFSTVWGKSSNGGNSGYMVLRASDSTVYNDYVRLSNTSLSKTYGDANPSLSSITLDGVGTGNAALAWGGAITTATNAGAYAYGTSNVLSVTDNSGSLYVDYGSGGLSVNKAPLTITASNASKIYDGLAFSGGNGLSYTGFVNGENASVLSGTASYGGTAQGAVNAGSYAITPSGLSAGNYAISYVDGALSVNKAPLTITANNASKTYDGLAFSGGNGVSYAGFVSGENTSVLSGSLNYGGTAQGAVNAGSYAITPSGLSAGNYAIGYVDGGLTVNKAAISAISGITAANKTYDGTTTATLNMANAAFAGMISGDSLRVATATGRFGDADLGIAKAVFITGLSLGGADAGNYTLSNATATATANIDTAVVAPLWPQQVAVGSRSSIPASTFASPAPAASAAASELIEVDDTSKEQPRAARSTDCASSGSHGSSLGCGSKSGAPGQM